MRQRDEEIVAKARFLVFLAARALADYLIAFAHYFPRQRGFVKARARQS
jgi:hypothetical protein